jgi:hypothetical protein
MADNDLTPGNITTVQPKSEIVQTQPIALSLETVQGFEGLQRAARMFAASDLVPKAYQGNVANATIALAVALRLRADPLMVLQNLHIIHGKPGWSSTFLIAAINQSGRFTPLRFVFTGQKGTDSWGCCAYATDLKSQEKLEGTEVTMAMAKAEGWTSKDGSKWRTMPEQMLRYRAASFWSRIYASEITMGFLTAEEVDESHEPVIREVVVQAPITRAPEPVNPSPVVTQPEVVSPVPSPAAPPPAEVPAAKAGIEEAKRILESSEPTDKKAKPKRVGDIIRERMAREAAEAAAKAATQPTLPVPDVTREPGEEG